MRVTIVGSGDAFGSGGRFNTCFFVETARGTLLVDCGASALVALKAQGIDPLRIDGIVLSHLHGDHFGGLPFLLLDGQFLARRERPLTIAGPPGTRTRVDQLMEVFFPKSTGSNWRFPWEVVEIDVGRETEILGSQRPDRGGHPSFGRALDRASPVRRRKAVRLFGRHRMDRRADRHRGRRRPVHLRVLRLFRLPDRPPELGGSQSAAARSARAAHHDHAHESQHAGARRRGEGGRGAGRTRTA